MAALNSTMTTPTQRRFGFGQAGFLLASFLMTTAWQVAAQQECTAVEASTGHGLLQAARRAEVVNSEATSQRMEVMMETIQMQGKMMEKQGKMMETLLNKIEQVEDHDREIEQELTIAQRMRDSDVSSPTGFKMMLAQMMANGTNELAETCRGKRALPRQASPSMSQRQVDMNSKIEVQGNSCKAGEITLFQFTTKAMVKTCCPADRKDCAGCERFDQKCLACAGGYVMREGQCVACMDSAGWTDSDGKTCAQLTNSQCNDELVMGISSNRACCACGGGHVSATLFEYVRGNFALGDGISMQPIPRTASRYSVNEACDLTSVNLTIDGQTGVIAVAKGRSPPSVAAKVNCEVTAWQPVGGTKEVPISIPVAVETGSFLYERKTLVFSQGTVHKALKAKGTWKDFNVICSPQAKWLKVAQDSGDLSVSEDASDYKYSGAVTQIAETESYVGLRGAVCEVKGYDASKNKMVAAKIAALKPDTWDALTYGQSAVSVTMGDDLPLLNLNPPASGKSGALKPNNFDVACDASDEHKAMTVPFTFDRRNGVGFLNGHPVLEVNMDGQIKISPSSSLVSVFDALTEVGSARKFIKLSCSIWGWFPDASFAPLHTKLEVKIKDSFCWVKQTFKGSSFKDPSASSEAACRTSCRLSPSCSHFAWTGSECNRYRVNPYGSSITAFAKITNCTDENTCFQLAHDLWRLAGRYCPLGADFLRGGLAYRKEGATNEETMVLTKYSKAVDGEKDEKLKNCKEGSWIVRHHHPKDFILAAKGYFELYGKIEACIAASAHNLNFEAQGCAKPLLPEVKDGELPALVLDDPNTAEEEDFWLHPCDCVPPAWGSQPPVSLESIKQIPPGNDNNFQPGPISVVSGQFVCPTRQLLPRGKGIHYESDTEMMEPENCQGRCADESECKFFWSGDQNGAKSCRLYSDCEYLVREFGTRGELKAFPREKSCVISDPEKCWATSLRRKFLTSKQSDSNTFRFLHLHQQCDSLSLLGGMGVDRCARPGYRPHDTGSQKWAHKRQLPASFEHGMQLDVSCWKERYAAIGSPKKSQAEETVGTNLACVNGAWFNFQGLPELQGFQCQGCVQVGASGLKSFEQQNEQELYFLNRMKFSLYSDLGMQQQTEKGGCTIEHKVVSGGIYAITSTSAGRRLFVAPTSGVGACKGYTRINPDQKWELIGKKAKDGSTIFKIKNAYSKRCLYAQRRTSAWGGFGAVHNVGSDGWWKIEAVPNEPGNFIVINAYSNRALYASPCCNWRDWIGAIPNKGGKSPVKWNFERVDTAASHICDDSASPPAASHKYCLHQGHSKNVELNPGPSCSPNLITQSVADVASTERLMLLEPDRKECLKMEQVESEAKLKHSPCNPKSEEQLFAPGTIPGLLWNMHVQTSKEMTRGPATKPPRKIFDGECQKGKQLRVYDGNGDNKGTPEQQVHRCHMACLQEKDPKDKSKSWDGFVAKGFAVQQETGRCLCEDSDSAHCPRTSATKYTRYDYDLPKQPLLIKPMSVKCGAHGALEKVNFKELILGEVIEEEGTGSSCSFAPIISVGSYLFTGLRNTGVGYLAGDWKDWHKALAKHPVGCASGEALTGLVWKKTKYSSGMYASCSKIAGLGSCTEGYSAQGAVEAFKPAPKYWASALGLLSITCPVGSVLNMFHLEFSEGGMWIRFRYTCCKVGGAPVVFEPKGVEAKLVANSDGMFCPVSKDSSGRLVYKNKKNNKILKFHEDGKWCIDSECTKDKGAVTPEYLSSNAFDIVNVSDFDGNFEGGGQPKLQSKPVDLAKALKLLKRPKRPKQPKQTKLAEFKAEQPSYAEECLKYEDLWNTVKETFKSDEGESVSQTSDLEADPATKDGANMVSYHPCSVAQSAGGIFGKLGGGDGSAAPSNMMYEDWNKCMKGDEDRELLAAHWAHSDAMFDVTQEVAETAGDMACGLIPDLEMAAMGFGAEMEPGDICSDLVDMASQVSGLAHTSMSANRDLQMEVEGYNACNPLQVGFARMFCDVHCVRDAVIRGDRTIIRNLESATKITNGNIKKLAEWQVKASHTDVTWLGEKMDHVEDVATTYLKNIVENQKQSAASLVESARSASKSMLAELGGLAKAASFSELSQRTARAALEDFVSSAHILQGDTPNASSAITALQQVAQLHDLLRMAAGERRSWSKAQVLGKQLAREADDLQKQVRLQQQVLGVYRAHSESVRSAVRNFSLVGGERRALLLRLDGVWWKLRDTLDKYMDTADEEVTSLQSAVQTMADYENCAAGFANLVGSYTSSISLMHSSHRQLQAAWRTSVNLVGELSAILVDGEAFATFMHEDGCKSSLAQQTLKQAKLAVGGVKMLVHRFKVAGMKPEASAVASLLQSVKRIQKSYNDARAHCLRP